MANQVGRYGARAPRVNIRLPVQLAIKAAKVTVATEAINTSHTGMLIATDLPLATGTLLAVSVPLGDDQILFETTAVVVRQHPDADHPGVGIEFVSLPEHAVDLITRLAADETNFGKYHLEALIGSGGMGEVFRARQIEGQHLGKTIAIKRLLPSLVSNPIFRDLFVTEADVTKMLRHPAIIEVLETGEVGNSLYIAMEFIDGGNLRQLLNACQRLHRPLPIDLACFIAHRVATALDYAHHATSADGTPVGIIHCDVTPSNIFVSYAAEVKLADFGVAQISTFFGPGKGTVLVGRPQYRAPEQILFKKLCPATDVFALGAVFFELLTLNQAFAGEDVAAVHKKITSGTVSAPSLQRPEITGNLDRVVLSALSRRIRGAPQPWWTKIFAGRVALERFADAASMAQDLSGFCGAEDQSQEALQQFIQSLHP